MNWKKAWRSFEGKGWSEWSSKPAVVKIRDFVQGKAFLTVLMVLLLGGSIGFHYFWSQGQAQDRAVNLQTDPAATQTPADPASQETAATQGIFDAFRLQREDTRAQEVEYLREILQDPSTDDTTRTTAQLQLSVLTDSMEKELTIETLVQAKGFERVIALSHEDSLNIVVGAQTLSEEEVAQILSIAMRESGRQADQIKIIPSVVD